VGSITSPAAKTPATDVRDDRPSTCTVPSAVSASLSCTRCVRGSLPIATKMPSSASSRVDPSTVERRTTPVTASPPRISATSLFQTNSIFSFASARACMILDARSSPRRWIT
jgi:hypothetical protein